MNLTILSFRSGTTPSLQGVNTASTVFSTKTIMCDGDHSNAPCLPFSMWRFLLDIIRET